MPFPTAPVDASGGILKIGMTDGLDEHFVTVHVKPFTATVPASPYAWTYLAAAGTETSVRAAAINFIDVIKPLYDSTWNFWVESLHRVTAGVATPVFPIPDVGAEVGTSAETSPALGDAARFCATVYDLSTALGGRFRFELCAAATHTGSSTGPRELQPPAVCTISAGGYDTVLDPAIIAYLEGANCGILAHDGQKPVGPAKLSIFDNKRLRRKYGFA